MKQFIIFGSQYGTAKSYAQKLSQLTDIECISYDELFTVAEDGTKSLPGNITLDMLSIPITSEAVQAENIPVGGAVGTEAAYAAFQYVAQTSSGSEG